MLLCHCVKCCFLKSLHWLLVHHSVFCVTAKYISSTVCTLSVGTSHFNVRWFFVTVSTTVFYSLSTVCQYLTLYRQFVICHYDQRFILQSLRYQLVPHIVPSVDSVSLCPTPASTLSPMSVSTSHCTVCLFSITMPSDLFYSLSTFCPYLTLNFLLLLCHCVHCCFIHSVHFLSVHHILLP